MDDERTTDMTRFFYGRAWPAARGEMSRGDTVIPSR